MLHAKVLEMLEGTSYGGAVTNKYMAGQALIACWALTYFEKFCELSWDPVSQCIQILSSASESWVFEGVGNMPSDMWKLYTLITGKLERYVQAKNGRKMYSSVRNERVLHAVAAWLVQRALTYEGITGVSGLSKDLVIYMKTQMTEAARQRLLDASLVLMKGGDADEVRRVKQLDPSQFLPHTLDVWAYAAKRLTG